MSALGHFNSMSALPPKVDIAECDGDVRFVPTADIAILIRPLRRPKKHLH